MSEHFKNEVVILSYNEKMGKKKNPKMIFGFRKSRLLLLFFFYFRCRLAETRREEEEREREWRRVELGNENDAVLERGFDSDSEED